MASSDLNVKITVEGSHELKKLTFAHHLDEIRSLGFTYRIEQQNRLNLSRYKVEVATREAITYGELGRDTLQVTVESNKSVEHAVELALNVARAWKLFQGKA